MGKSLSVKIIKGSGIDRSVDKLPLAGGTMTGDINIDSLKLKSAATLKLQTGNNLLDIFGVSDTLRVNLSLLNGLAASSPIIVSFPNKDITVAGLEDIAGGRIYKELDIGDWDMDTNANIAVNHGLSSSEWKTIRDVSIIIRNDANTVYYPLDNTIGATPSYYFNNTSFLVTRDNAGDFDSVNFASTSYNRGFITFNYTPD